MTVAIGYGESPATGSSLVGAGFDYAASMNNVSYMTYSTKPALGLHLSYEYMISQHFGIAGSFQYLFWQPKIYNSNYEINSTNYSSSWLDNGISKSYNIGLRYYYQIYKINLYAGIDLGSYLISFSRSSYSIYHLYQKDMGGDTVVPVPQDARTDTETGIGYSLKIGALIPVINNFNINAVASYTNTTAFNPTIWYGFTLGVVYRFD